MREIDRLAVDAASDAQKMTQLILENERFILRCASRAANRYLTKSDDEWAVALSAFAQAVTTYRFDRGSFLSLAELAIKRRLIDYRKSQARFEPEIMVNPCVFGGEPDEGCEDVSIRISMNSILAGAWGGAGDAADARLEIEAANQVFAAYAFSFFDLPDFAPKTKKTKAACARAAAFLLKNPPLTGEMRVSRQLPLKIIEKNTDVPRKVLERHRKYIIATVEILSGEYPCLAEYVRYIKEEMDK